MESQIIELEVNKTSGRTTFWPQKMWIIIRVLTGLSLDFSQKSPFVRGLYSTLRHQKLKVRGLYSLAGIFAAAIIFIVILIVLLLVLSADIDYHYSQFLLLALKSTRFSFTIHILQVQLGVAKK